MTKQFKPMLSGKAPADLTKLSYPVLASPKLDGIRCIIRDGVAVSRSLKPIPNDHVRSALEGLPDGIDGELMVDGGFSECQSYFMAKDCHHDDFWFFAFDWNLEDDPDCIEPHYFEQGGFQLRLAELTRWSETHGHNNLSVVEHVEIANAEDLAEYEAQCLAQGFEGVMVRDPNGAYKFGRSTTREGGLLKIKQFEDEEAIVVGVIERMHNDNELEQDNLGHAKRSSAQAGKRPAGDLGALVCRTADGAEFQIGTGFTSEQRRQLWEDHLGGKVWNRQWSLAGEMITFKHQPDPGGRKPGQAPRFPVFKGFRAAADL